VQATEMTGMSIFGKMSVGVRRMTAGLSKRMRIARTTNVYGRLRANRTIHMDVSLLGYGAQRKIRRSRACLQFLPTVSETSTTILTVLVSISFHVRCAMRPSGLIFFFTQTGMHK